MITLKLFWWYIPIILMSLVTGFSFGTLSRKSCGDDLIHLSDEISEMSKRNLELANLVSWHSDLRFKCEKEKNRGDKK